MAEAITQSNYGPYLLQQHRNPLTFSQQPSSSRVQRGGSTWSAAELSAEWGKLLTAGVFVDTNLCTHTNTCASEWGKLLTAGVFKDTNLCKQTEMCASEWGKLRIAGVFVDTIFCRQTKMCASEWGKLRTASVFVDTNFCRQIKMCVAEWGKPQLQVYLGTHTEKCARQSNKDARQRCTPDKQR